MDTINIAGYAFDGPYSYANLLPNRPGVWAVLDGRTLPPVDADEAEAIRESVESSDRYDCWRERCQRIAYAGLHVPDPDRRKEILERILDSYAVPCHPK